MLETIYAAKPSRHVVEKFVFPQRVEPRNAERAWIDTRPHNLRRSAVRELASAAKNHAAARSIVTIILPIGCPLLRGASAGSLATFKLGKNGVPVLIERWGAAMDTSRG
jgi:hypothetical protein